MVSEINTAPGYYDYSDNEYLEFPASAVLTDGIEDVRGSPSNYWRGEDNKEAGFVIDLGCRTFLKEIHIRRLSWK